jgi:hypothetical protein
MILNKMQNSFTPVPFFLLVFLIKKPSGKINPDGLLVSLI